MTHEHLDIELRLLILKYGRQHILESLARLGQQTLEEVSRDIVAAEGMQRTRRAKAKRTETPIMELVARESDTRPEIAESLRTLAARFQNRTFLPNLRDVRRFLDRLGTRHGTLKSRRIAGSALVRTLATMPKEDLARLALEAESSQSDYSLLAQAIMGTPESNKEGDSSS